MSFRRKKVAQWLALVAMYLQNTRLRIEHLVRYQKM